MHNQNITLEQQKRQVESANKLKSEFLSNMSHELRTPLNSILTLTHVLLLEAKSKLEEEEYSYLEIVHRNGKNLLEIINSILDLSKIEAGRMDIHTNRFSFKQMLSMVNENLQPLAKEKGIDYKIIFDEHIPKINSDELKLHQVFTNIIGNAIKFTESGFVEIKTRVEDKSIITSIKDTGIGISKNDLHDIFDEFHQSDGTSSRKYEGTGLGLAIARKLITMLGGELTAESEKGVGSIFTIKVPIEWHNKDAYTAPFSDKLTNNITSSNYINDFSERKILLVDDNEDIIKQMTGLLENLNINLEVAIGGEQALKLIDMSIPDGIILDLMMPSIDGFEVLKTISINQKTKNIPIIILTAKDLSKNDLKKLEFANIQFIVQKGYIYQKDLIDKVKHILSLKNERSILNPEYKKQKNKKVNIYIISEQKDNLISISALLKNNYNINEITDSDGKFNKIATNGNNIILVDTPPESLHKNEYLEKFIPNEKIIPYTAIVLSARAMKGDKDMYLSLGYDEYVSLPIDYDNLALKIDNLL